MESFNSHRYSPLIGEAEGYVQDNLSCSEKGILRGLHFQRPPLAQSKLVMVLKGRALDVAVDLRRNSPSYGKHFTLELNAEKMNQLFIPRGFAHGFVSLEKDTLFAYKCDNLYSRDSEVTIKWNDKDLGIDWGIQDPIISEKDSDGLSFSDLKSPF